MYACILFVFILKRKENIMLSVHDCSCALLDLNWFFETFPGGTCCVAASTVAFVRFVQLHN